ncbi:MAG: hypothetical protein CL931_02740 [Deltaproteobacteria bacterium]|nr:hypothetical protein [Deltaproteobacteria bacterium]
MATHYMALSLGIDDEPGTLSVVKWGDLVVLGADPRADLNAFAKPELVAAQGFVHTPNDWK